MAMTFLEAWRSRDRIAPDGGSLRPWLLGIATNVARGQRRAARRYRAALARLAVAGEVPDFAEDVSGRLYDAARIKALHRALAGLPRHELEILALCVWSGLGYAEAAEALNVPVGTVRSRLSRARAHSALCRSKIRFGPVTWGFSVDQAACVYSLVRLPRTGLRWIRVGAGAGQGEAGGGWIPVGDMLCGALVRPGGVVVLLVLREDGAQVRLAEDQRPAGDLAAQGARQGARRSRSYGVPGGAGPDSWAGGPGTRRRTRR